MRKIRNPAPATTMRLLQAGDGGAAGVPRAAGGCAGMAGLAGGRRGPLLLGAAGEWHRNMH